MNTINLTHIGFLLENTEEIWFKTEDFTDLEIETSGENIVKVNDTILSFRAVEWLNATISANANHTYNSFGNPSEVTNFKRLIDSQNICAVIVKENDQDCVLYVHDNMFCSIDLDCCGNLDLIVVPADSIIESCCDDEPCCDESACCCSKE